MIDCSGKAPELAHKDHIKKQGGKTNEGDSSKFTLMDHCSRKEAAALMLEAVDGLYSCKILTDFFTYSYKFLQILTYSYLFQVV